MCNIEYVYIKINIYKYYIIYVLYVYKTIKSRVDLPMTNLPVAAGMSRLVNSEIATESCRFTNPLMAFCIFH